MKRFICIIKSLCLSFVIPIFAGIIAGNVVVGETIYNPNCPVSAEIDNFFCDTDSENSDYTKKVISSVGTNTISLLNEHGYKLKLVDTIDETSLKPTKERHSYTGVTRQLENTIEIKDGKYEIGWTIPHEIGHALADVYYEIYGENPSFSDEFAAIYEEEKDNFYFVQENNTDLSKAVQNKSKSDYYKTTQVEYFVSVYANIVYSGDKYANTAPKSYAYVKDVLKTLNLQ